VVAYKRAELSKGLKTATHLKTANQPAGEKPVISRPSIWRALTRSPASLSSCALEMTAAFLRLIRFPQGHVLVAVPSSA